MAKLLLIEDAHDLAKVIRLELERAGHKAMIGASGHEGLRLFLDEEPDLVILDWMLPDMDGLEVLRQIRDRSVVPVLMLTARGDEVDRVIGLELGADDYMSKPFGMRELTARIRALLRRMASVAEMVAQDRTPTTAVLRYGPLRLTPEGYEAMMGDSLLELTRTEFDLLALLVRNPGRAFSRDYLLDAIWGENYVAGDRSVDNAVLRLRKKLGALGECVETVWGVGYRMRAPSVSEVKDGGAI